MNHTILAYFLYLYKHVFLFLYNVKRSLSLEYWYYVIYSSCWCPVMSEIKITILVMKLNFNPFLWQYTKNCDLKNQNIQHTNTMWLSKSTCCCFSSVLLTLIYMCISCLFVQIRIHFDDTRIHTIPIKENSAHWKVVNLKKQLTENGSAK